MKAKAWLAWHSTLHPPPFGLLWPWTATLREGLSDFFLMRCPAPTGLGMGQVERSSARGVSQTQLWMSMWCLTRWHAGSFLACGKVSAWTVEPHQK